MHNNSFTLNSAEKHMNSMLKDILASYENNNQNMLVFIWDKNDRVIYLSDQVGDYFEVEPSAILSLKWTDVLPGIVVQEIQQHYKQSKEQLDLTPFTFSEKHENNDVFNGFVAPLFLEEKLFYVCQLYNRRPMTDLKDFLVDTEKLILSSQLTASLIHEIRNPLTSLKGFLQLVQSGIEQKEEYFKVIVAEIEKLEDITAELLQMSRPNRQAKTKEAVESLIHDVIFLLETQIDMRNIHFDIDLEANLFIECHASQIKQVLLNLLKNGAEAMDKTGVINIHTVKKDKEILIHIIDEGKGISNDAVAELNNPFYTTKSDGTGLGLVVTEHILENHQGELRVSSEENKGAIFTVVLPVYAN